MEPQTSETKPQNNISLLELLVVVSVCGTIAAGTFTWYLGEMDRLVANGMAETVSMLGKTPMNEACPGRSEVACKTFGDYRVRQMGDCSWVVTEISKEGEGDLNSDLAVITEGKIFVNDRANVRYVRGAKEAVIKGLTGKRLSAFAVNS
jgi:hypothetical protein